LRDLQAVATQRAVQPDYSGPAERRPRFALQLVTSLGALRSWSIAARDGMTSWFDSARTWLRIRAPEPLSPTTPERLPSDAVWQISLDTILQWNPDAPALFVWSYLAVNPHLALTRRRWTTWPMH
jgi:hypothetical protein